jgi:hypothetical protein
MSSPDELHMLIGGYLDGHLTADQLAELARRLAADPAAVAAFAELAMTDVLLEQYFHNAGMDATADVLLGSQRSKLEALAFLVSDEDCLEGVCGSAELPSAGRHSLGFRFFLAASVVFVLVGLSVAVGHWGIRGQEVASTAVTTSQSDSSLATIERTMLVPTTGGQAVAAGSRIYPGQSIRIDSGLVVVRIDAGASLILKGPADLQLLSPLRAILHRGTVTAKVDQSAQGFRVDTPNANVVDLGTEFGVSVSDGGETDVVVFAGKVKMHVPSVDLSPDDEFLAEPPLASSRLLRSGEALRVSSGGAMCRLVSIDSSQFPTSVTTADRPAAASSLILNVSDNLRENDTTKCYHIVPGGLVEDAPAYVDRTHEWNGVDEQGIPSFLRNADYIMPFNDDKLVDRLNVKLMFTQPALLYVFFDDRVPTPDWLQQRFQNTGYKIGLDEGNYPNADKDQGVGPGESVDNVCSIWVTKVDAGAPVTLDAVEATEEFCSMYGMAVTPLPSSQQD